MGEGRNSGKELVRAWKKNGKREREWETASKKVRRERGGSGAEGAEGQGAAGGRKAWREKRSGDENNL